MSNQEKKSDSKKANEETPDKYLFSCPFYLTTGMKQFMGKSLRSCSHSTLTEGNRTIKVILFKES